MLLSDRQKKMNIKAEQLSAHLKSKSLSSIYIISGDELLLVQEAADAVRAAAKLNGHIERKLFHADSKFDWNDILTEVDSRSLFSNKKFLEIRIITGKPGDEGSKALQAYLKKVDPETFTLIVTPKLDKASTRSKWFTALEAQGIFIQIWPIGAHQLPQWLNQRLNQSDIKVSGEALSILAENIEGNLLAAIQEIEKLKLLAPKEEMTGEAMSVMVTDSAKFNVFSLVDRIMEGEAQKACRILHGLRSDGTEAAFVLWAITRHLRIIFKGSEAVASSENIDSALLKLGVWENKKTLVKKTINRTSSVRLQQMLKLSGGIDRSLKGVGLGSSWDELTTLTLLLCGVQSLSSKNLRLALQ